MEKLFEKRNLGIPTTLLTFFAFLIGYGMTQSYSVMLVAVLYAVIVFSLQFDDMVRSAVKQSYIISFIVIVVYMVMDVFDNFASMISSGNVNLIQRALAKVFSVGRDLIDVVVIVFFIIFMIFALLRKEMKFGFVANMLGEGTPKQKPAPQPAAQKNYQQYQQPPVTPVQPQAAPQQYQQAPPQQYQQPTQPMYQQAPVQPAPAAQPVAPAAQPIHTEQGNRCSRCGELNKEEAVFCASCGNKLK